MLVFHRLPQVIRGSAVRAPPCRANRLLPDRVAVACGRAPGVQDSLDFAVNRHLTLIIPSYPRFATSDIGRGGGRSRPMRSPSRAWPLSIAKSRQALSNLRLKL